MNLEAIRSAEFPWTVDGRGVIYLNHASTGPLPQRTVRALAEANQLRAEPWRLTLDHQFGVLAHTRDLIARLIGSSPQEIAVMTNTTHGINLAARALPFRSGDIVLSVEREFPANVYPWMALAATRGVTLRQLECPTRLPSENAIIAALEDSRVRAVAVSWVGFEHGAKLDLARLGSECRSRGVYFVVDAMQGLGAAQLDVRTTPIDILACGSQKWLLGPWGTGFVYVRRELIEQLEPREVGWMAPQGTDDFTRLLDYDLTWRSDARRFEVVTLPYHDFWGMNASLELLHEVGVAEVATRVELLADRIVDWAQSRSDIQLVTPSERTRRAGVVSFVPRDAAAVSARLTNARVTHSLREGAIRLSPHFYQTVEEVDRALALI
ncbi:MAG TPA: aminotransferase class V-fold PLP-dependent enzyme [Gemmatimonadaceae bacterium]|nr:aminotransferase class V-fold PLP-dependent enzyme [Gemmatimonadaceae bacterium]